MSDREERVTLKLALARNCIRVMKESDAAFKAGDGKELYVPSIDEGLDWTLCFPVFPGDVLTLLRLHGDALEWIYLPLQVVIHGPVALREAGEALERIVNDAVKADREKRRK